MELGLRDTGAGQLAVVQGLHSARVTPEPLARDWGSSSAAQSWCRRERGNQGHHPRSNFVAKRERAVHCGKVWGVFCLSLYLKADTRVSSAGESLWKDPSGSDHVGILLLLCVSLLQDGHADSR